MDTAGGGTQEGGSRYEHVIDLKNANDSHTLAVAATAPGARVLDVGCADGSVGAVLKARGCHVVGIDSDADALLRARDVLDQAVQIDLDDQAGLDEALGQIASDRRFDFILFLDVLEHLRHPEAALSTIVDRFLAPHGRVVISIPNIAHGAVRLSLLEGRFAYQPWGLLDRTHVVFFTAESVRELISSAGLTPIVEAATHRAIDGTEIPVDLASLDPGLLDLLKQDPLAEVYQFFVIAARADADDPVTVELSNVLQELPGRTAPIVVPEPALAEEPVEVGPSERELMLEGLHSALTHELEQAHQALADAQHTTDGLTGRVADLEATMERLRDEVVAGHAALDAANQQVRSAHFMIDEQRAKLDRARAVEERLRAVESSQAWLIGYTLTHPIRIVKRLRDALRGSRR